MDSSPIPSRFADLPARVATPLPAIEAYLAQMLDRLDAPESLHAAMAYATLDGGKRLRPLLVWHGCVAAGGKGEASLPACAAVELVHCFSLVHDDLPALDNDDLRRGRATLHRHAGEAMAILAGDALLNHAYRVLAGGLSPALFAAAAGELSWACEQMIAGQVLDTLGFEVPRLSEPDRKKWRSEPGDSRLREPGHPEPGHPERDRPEPGRPEPGSLEQRLEIIHHGKTGAMLVASLRMGAVCSGGGPVLGHLSEFGRNIGLMFQIVDDLLDVTQPAEHLGKRTGKDIQAGKLTYPGVFGVERSREMVGTLRAKALCALSDLGPTAEPLRLIAEYLAVRSR